MYVNFENRLLYNACFSLIYVRQTKTVKRRNTDLTRATKKLKELAEMM